MIENLLKCCLSRVKAYNKESKMASTQNATTQQSQQQDLQEHVPAADVPDATANRNPQQDPEQHVERDSASCQLPVFFANAGGPPIMERQLQCFNVILFGGNVEDQRVRMLPAQILQHFGVEHGTCLSTQVASVFILQEDLKECIRVVPDAFAPQSPCAVFGQFLFVEDETEEVVLAALRDALFLLRGFPGVFKFLLDAAE